MQDPPSLASMIKQHYQSHNCIGRCCCRLLHFGPLYFWKVLPMHSDRPIALADATANCFTLAYYFSGRLCQCTLVGPLHWGMLLLMALLWPIIFLGGSADALQWAHRIREYCS